MKHTVNSMRMKELMATDFLSCDGNFLTIPDDRKFQSKSKTKMDPPTMISIASISSHLATDHPLHKKVRKHQPRVCCTKVNTISQIAASITLVVTLVVVGFFVVRVLQSDDPQANLGQRLAGLLVPTFLLVLFFLCFLWGLYTKRHRPMIPYLLGSFLILFASIGAVIVLGITMFYEMNNSTTNSPQKSGDIWNILAFRIAALLVVILQVFFTYCYVRSFLFIRYINKQ